MLMFLQKSPRTARSPLHQKVKTQRSACHDLWAAIFVNHLRPSVFVFFSRRPGRRPSDETIISDPTWPAFSKMFQHPSIMRACRITDCFSSSELLRDGPSMWDPPDLELDGSKELRSAPSGAVPAFAGRPWEAGLSADRYASSQTGSGQDPVQMCTCNYLCDRTFLHARSVTPHSLSGDSGDPAAAPAPSGEAMFRGEASTDVDWL